MKNGKKMRKGWHLYRAFQIMPLNNSYISMNFIFFLRLIQFHVGTITFLSILRNNIDCLPPHSKIMVSILKPFSFFSNHSESGQYPDSGIVQHWNCIWEDLEFPTRFTMKFSGRFWHLYVVDILKTNKLNVSVVTGVCLSLQSCEASLLASFHVTRLLEGGLALPVMDTTFFNQCSSSIANFKQHSQQTGTTYFTANELNTTFCASFWFSSSTKIGLS